MSQSMFQLYMDKLKVCVICKVSIEDITIHRECLLKGLEQGLFQSKTDWLNQCKPKPRRMIRRVRVE
jgi:hypothetical protein